MAYILRDEDSAISHYNTSISSQKSIGDVAPRSCNDKGGIESLSAYNEHHTIPNHIGCLPLWQRSCLSLGRHWPCSQRAYRPSCSTFKIVLFTAPQDVDILVNTFYYDAEQIKAIIVDTDDRYFLKPARWRNADYKVLFCRLPGWHARRRCVKVDILVPPSGKLGLPEILASDTPIIYYIPVMPLFALLVMKTQGWRDHRISPRKDLRAKEGGDVVDVDALLDRAAEEDVDYEDECEKYTSEFMDKALVLARTFVRRRGRREKWKAIGFPL